MRWIVIVAITIQFVGCSQEERRQAAIAEAEKEGRKLQEMLDNEKRLENSLDEFFAIKKQGIQLRNKLEETYTDSQFKIEHARIIAKEDVAFSEMEAGLRMQLDAVKKAIPFQRAVVANAESRRDEILKD